jgi:RHS repeat-associated protein
MVTMLRQLLTTILSFLVVSSSRPGDRYTVSHAYDSVGNRTQKVSTIPGFPGGLTNYNANDQLSTDTYDNDGNTTASNGLGYVYDFENHVIQAGAGITMVYDGDGNRVQKTVAGLTTKYLVDTQSPTSYAQVVQENYSGSVSATRELSRVFVYGLERVSQLRSYLTNGTSHTQTSYYVYDGHGSTRALTDPNGAVTDTYDYDAFGNLLHSTATGIPPGGTTVAPTPNEFLFAGEQFDSDLNLYYNRARYLNVSTGRFWSMDTQEGEDESPLSLHKYLYCDSDPVNGRDPSGHDELAEVGVAEAIQGTINSMTSAISTAMRIYNLASNVASVADYLPLALDLMEAFAQPSPALVQAAVVDAVERKFGPLGVANLTGSLSTALRTLAPSWSQIANRIEQEAPVMAEEIAPEIARRIPTYIKAQETNRLKIVFFMPTGPGPRSADAYVDVGSKTQLAIGLSGGRLFGLGFRTSSGNVDQAFRLDYWEPFAVEPLQIHYHIYGDQDFPPRKIWP